MTVVQPLPAELPGAHVFTTTRRGGVSVGPYASLNLGSATGDDPAAVAENWRRVRKAVALPIVRMGQVHGARAEVVRGAEPDLWPDTDALATAVPGITVCVLAADCVPVAASDPVAGVVGVAHAGWRGTAGGVLGSLFTAIATLGGRPEDTWLAMGPCIAGPDYEVGPEVAAAIAAALPPEANEFAGQPVMMPGRADRSLLDLPRALACQARAAGVAPARIALPTVSTFAAAEDYPSHRRDGAASARFCLGVSLAEGGRSPQR